jgi:uncharacterized delta-60 repeat protein
MSRTVVGLLFLLALAVSTSLALRETSAATVSPISYHNGPVMAGTTDTYVIWYGSWVALTGPNSLDTQNIIGNFMSEIGGSIHSQVNATYPGVNGSPSGGLIYGGSVTASTPHGVELDAAAIQAIVSENVGGSGLPVDPNGIYILITSSDIGSSATGLCAPNTPPYHGYFTRGAQTLKYAFVGNAARCPNIAASQFFAADGSQLPTPNGNLAADAMVSTIMHALDATVTDPIHTAWFDGFGLESADKCQDSFSRTWTTANGARANFGYNGHGDNYLIQDNLVNNYGGYCGQQNDAPPRPDDQTVRVSQDTTQSITLTATDDNGDTVTFTVVTPPQHGTLTGNGATRTYTPATGYRGTDSFTFKANDGTLDSVAAATVSINVNGNSASDGFDPNANGLVRTVAVQADGKTLIGGDFTTLAPNGGASVTRNYIARLNSDGTVDTTFNPNANSSIQAIALQPDGKILLAGDFSAFAPNGGASVNSFYIARFNADGTIDATFDPRANGSVHAVAVQFDGQIVIGGEFTGFNPGGGATVGRNRVARLNPNGALDPAFNPSANATVDTLALQADGRILMGGRFTTLAPSGGATVTRSYLARFNIDGTLDAAFDPKPDNILGSLAVQPDGKILIGGSFVTLSPNGGALVTRNHIARLNGDGTVDTAFDPNVNSFVRIITLEPDGRILIGGGFTTVATVLHKYIARLNPDGTVDPGVNPSPQDQVFAIAVQPDNKIVVGGVFSAANGFNGQTRNRIARLETDGRLDQTLNLNAIGDVINATAVQPDGKIIVGGVFTSVLGVARNNIARLNSDGTLDTTFNPNVNGGISAVAVQADGKIVVGGFFSAIAPNGGTSISRNNVARLNSDGTVDPAFDPRADDYVDVIVIQPDGKLLVGGAFGLFAPNGGATVGGSQIARLNTNGTVDTAFSGGANGDVLTIALQVDGKILIGGKFIGVNSKTRNHIARLNSDGTLDQAFDPNASNLVTALAVQPDGQIVVGGYFTGFAPNGGAPVARFRMARLNLDGTVENAFNPNVSDAVKATVLQADGRILIGGMFTVVAPNGGVAIPRNHIARLNADGTADMVFDPNASSAVYAIALQADAKILVGGPFDGINGQARGLFARLANDTAALQGLAVTTTNIVWSRSGPGPQLTRVTFERSNDGINYTFLGNGTRAGAGNDFTLSGLSLPTQQSLYVRARGVYRGGDQLGSESITESVRRVYLLPPMHLSFSQQPNTTTAGSTLAPPVTVQIRDTADNPVNYSAAVTIAINSNPSSGTLSGTRTVSAVGGIATFNDLSIDKPGSRYNLIVSGVNFGAAGSNFFDITTAPASAIAVSAGSGQSAAINSGFAIPLQAIVTDALGKPVNGITVTFTAPANGPSGTFANNTSTTTAASNASGVATASAFTANGTAGVYAVTASINGGSPATNFGLTNNKANQTINVTTHAPAGALYNTQFNVAATSSSGLPVSFSSSGGCTNNGAVVTINAGTGNCTVKYDQAGDSNHSAAPQVSETVTAQKASQTITFAALANKTFGDADFTVSASVNSGLNVSFSAAGNCAVSSNTVHINSAGPCTITASQAGGANYDAAAEVARSFNIAKAGQTISFGALPNRTSGDADFSISANASSGLALSFTATGQCSVSGSNVHLDGAGVCTITASQQGDANHEAANDVSQSFQIAKAGQTITFDTLPDKTFGDADFAINASAVSGLAVSFRATGQCAVAVSSVHLNGAGACTITASQQGDANHEAASDVSQIFQIAKASTATGLSYLGNSSTGQDVTFTASVTSGAGVPNGTVTFRFDGSTIATCTDVALNSGTTSCVISAISAGSHTVTADYSGDANFNASNGTFTGETSGGSVFEFSLANYVVAERGGAVTITVKRTGDISAAASVDYATDDGTVPSVSVPCSLVTGFALERCDYTRAAGTLYFAANETEKSFVVLVNDDSYSEGPETTSPNLSNPGSGAALGHQATATLQITDDVPESSGNPVDDDANFVRQHYHDFLNREADADGLRFWTNNIASCDTDGCPQPKLVDTSAAFFLSIEFQETGYFVERFYKVSYGDATGASNFAGAHQVSVPIIRLREFLRDTQEIGLGVVVGQGAWPQQLESHKQAFAQEFVSRSRFTNAYPVSLTAAQFVNQLNANAGSVLTEAELTDLEAMFGGSNAPSADAAKRAEVLRSIVDNQALRQQEFNRAFVLMQYFGYLRRNPDDAQDTDYTGYDFWLRKLEEFHGSYIDAEMVKAFVTSIEYRQRFGQ